MADNKKLKVGVIGLRRGAGFAGLFNSNPDSKIVAVCDFDEVVLRNFIGSRKDVTGYADYDKFLEHDMDAVMLCSYCTDHAPQAVKALDAGKHVLSEVIACKTLAEGVELCRAVERSKKTYMFSENYCYFSYTQEMRKLYEEGIIGEYRYGECEYVHDTREITHLLTNGPDHWRNWIPSTYYCTHSLGPIVMITGTRPVKVNGFVIPNKISREWGRKGDDGSVVVCTMDNGAITRVIPWSFGPHDSIWYRVHGLKGAMENNRWKDTDALNLFIRNVGGKDEEKTYTPQFRKYTAEAAKYGHGGGDFFVVWEFVDAVINNKKSPIDVYRAMDMTLPGILGFRSALNNNMAVEVPDMRKEEVRKKYENDRWSPDPKDKGVPGQPYPSVLGKIDIPDSVYMKMDELRKKA